MSVWIWLVIGVICSFVLGGVFGIWLAATGLANQQKDTGDCPLCERPI